MVSRIIDPTRHIERAADAQHGVETIGGLRREIEDTQKLDAEFSRTQNYIYHETLQFYLPNVPANTESIMYRMFATSTTAIGLLAGGVGFGIPARVTSIRLDSNATITAGTAQPLILINEPEGLYVHTVDGATIDSSSFVTSNIHVFPWKSALQISSSGELSINILTDAAFAPTTADMRVDVTLGYQEWI